MRWTFYNRLKALHPGMVSMTFGYNRQLHKLTVLRGGIRRANQAAKEVKGFRLFDKVRFRGIECFISGRRTSSYFDLRKLDGTKAHASASWKQVRLLEHPGTTLIERRAVLLS